MLQERLYNAGDEGLQLIARLNTALPLVQQKDQTLLLTDPESQQYLELMQEFTQYMQQWKSVLFSPKYEIVHNSEKYFGERWYGYDIARAEGIQQIVPISKENESSGSGIVRVHAISTYTLEPHRRKRRTEQLIESLTFETTPLGDDEITLTDPLTNTPLGYVSIIAERVRETTTRGKLKKQSGEYSIEAHLGIANPHQDALTTRYTLYPNAVRIGRENENLPVLSNAHAQVVLHLIDSYIPRTEPQPATAQQAIPIRRTPTPRG